jgi:hypothetical protein
MCMFVTYSSEADPKASGTGWKIMNGVMLDRDPPDDTDADRKMVLRPCFGVSPRGGSYQVGETYKRTVDLLAQIQVGASKRIEAIGDPQFYPTGFHVFTKRSQALELLRYQYDYHRLDSWETPYLVQVNWEGLLVEGFENPCQRRIKLYADTERGGFDATLQWLVDVKIVDEIMIKRVENNEGQEVTNEFEGIRHFIGTDGADRRDLAKEDSPHYSTEED